MKRLLSALVTMTMIMGIGTPVQAKSKTLYVLSKFTTTDHSRILDQRFSYNKKGLVTKIESYNKAISHRVATHTATFRYTYKKNKLTKSVLDYVNNDGNYPTYFKYQGQKIIVTWDGNSQTYIVKNNRIIRVTGSGINYTYRYNKKGQFVEERNDGYLQKTKYKYDQKGYATSFDWVNAQIAGHFINRITYKHNLPSVIKETVSNTHATFRFYYKKMTVSSKSLKLVKSQQYSFLHRDDPKAELLYGFSYPSGAELEDDS